MFFAQNIKYTGLAFLKRLQLKVVAQFGHPNPNLETTKYVADACHVASKNGHNSKVTTVNADVVDPHSSQKYSEALNVITSYGMVIY
jgi:hypothetical protein